MLFFLKRNISEYFSKNKYWFYLIALLFIVGIAVGVQQVNSSGADFQNLVASMRQSSGDFQEILRNSFLKNLKYNLYLLISATSVVGFPVAAYLIFSKGVTLGSAVTILFLNTQETLTMSLCLIPQLLFLILSFFFLSQMSMHYSFEMAKKVFFHDPKKNPFGKMAVTLVLLFLVSGAFLFLSALCEAYCMPLIGN